MILSDFCPGRKGTDKTDHVHQEQCFPFSACAGLKNTETERLQTEQSPKMLQAGTEEARQVSVRRASVFKPQS